MMEGVRIIVADGQTGGGKDEFLRCLEADPWFQRNALFVEESATRVHLTHRITRGQKATWTPSMWVAFQRAIAEGYRFAMAIALHRARERGRSVVITNRYYPSGAAYLPGGLRQLSETIGMSLAEMSEGIDHVICPGPPPEWAYVRHADDDPDGYRFESYEDACDVGAKARQAYIDLGFVPGERLHDIPGRESFEEKCQHFVDTIRRLVGADC